MTLRRSTAIRATMTMLLIALASVTTQAQGRGGGRHRGGDDSQPNRQGDDQAKEWSDRFEEMASTKPVLKDVKVEKSAKDSIGRIEQTYKNRFHTYANAAKRTFDDAHAQSEPPNFGQLDTLFGDARKLQDQEYSDLRQLLADDQRATFDANVVRRRADDDKEAAARRERMQRSRSRAEGGSGYSLGRGSGIGGRALSPRAST